MREKAEALLHNDLKRTLSNEETTNNTGISAECIQLWLVEKDKKKRKACQQNTNKKNFLLPSIRTPLFSKSSTWWKEVHEVSPIFRFPMKGDYGLTEKAKKDEEKIGSQNETNGSLSISEVDSNQPNQSGEEVAKLLVSLHPQNRNSEWRENVGARTDSTLSRNSLPRAAVNQPTQRNNISPSLKTQIDALFIMEDDKALCHICGQRDWNNPWLIRCKIEECSMLYHPGQYIVAGISPY